MKPVSVPLGEAHSARYADQTARVIKPPGSRTVAYGIAGIGALIVLVAAINFVTLMTARKPAGGGSRSGCARRPVRAAPT